MTRVRVQMTDNAEVARMLDGVTELPCSICTELAAVPEYVLSIVVHRGQSVPIVVCEACCDILAAELRADDSGGGEAA